MQHDVDKGGTILVQGVARRVPVRGPSGRLYGYLDPERMILEVKRKGEPPEQIDLRMLQQIRT